MSKNSKNGRDGRGRFAKGNPGGPGRPRRPTEAAYLRVVLNACSLDDWEQIVSQAVNDAKNGDAAARRWLASYLVGQPKAEALSLVEALAREEAGFDEVASRAKSLELDALIL